MTKSTVSEEGCDVVRNLHVARRGHVLYLTIAREERHNALSRATIAEIGETFARHAADETILAAVLRGAGEKSFAAGGDIRDLEAVRTLEEAAGMSTDTRRAFDRIRDFPVPVIAAINGNALGGGAELAAACDLRVGAAHARIGFIQGRMGLTTAWGGGLDLCSIVGFQKALWLTLSGEILNGHDALQAGLLDALAGDGETLEDALERILAPLLSQPRIVLASFKALNRAARLGLGRDELETQETALFGRSWVSDAHWQAVEAFNARRKA